LLLPLALALVGPPLLLCRALVLLLLVGLPRVKLASIGRQHLLPSCINVSGRSTGAVCCCRCCRWWWRRGVTARRGRGWHCVVR
jgi:hypothetical protein